MHGLVFPNCGLRLPTSSSRPSLGKALYGNSDGTLLFASRRDLVQPPALSIRSEGNRRGRPPRRKISPEQTAKEDEEQKGCELSNHESSDSSNQEEIIALFRRIQSSISKEGSASSLKRSHALKKQPVKSVQEGQNRYSTGKQLSGKSLNKEGEGASLPRRRGSPKRVPAIENNPNKGDFNLSRPASNFVKRSPIPSHSAPAERVEVLREDPSTPGESLELQRVDKLKLPELKELAKSKGIKGYSKLKKAELVEMLMRSLQS
ncbi:SAP-like protein BP-73 isoform X2 [Aristolochia californica]|uniref:SAP-like protein BP-73 isoform X2 n=1 Tax=Aristolochia californica TaxID=171875 RepID=UPI0035E10BC7